MSTSEIDRPPAPGDTPPSVTNTPLWPQIRPFVLRLHFYAGILVGPFLLIAAVTGLLYTISPQLSDYVHRHELTVDQVGDQQLPLSEQVAAARAAHPEGSITEVRPPIDAESTHPCRAGGRRRSRGVRADRVRRPLHRAGPRRTDHVR